MFELLNRLFQYFQYIYIRGKCNKIIPLEDTEDTEDTGKSKYFNNIVDNK